MNKENNNNKATPTALCDVVGKKKIDTKQNVSKEKRNKQSNTPNEPIMGDVL